MSIYPPRPIINKVADTTADRIAFETAENAPIPIVYGRARLGGKIAVIKSLLNYKYILAVFALGEIDSFEAFYINDEAVTPEASYTGTTAQTADPTMKTLFAGYNDTLVLNEGGVSVGVAYAVFKVSVTAEVYSINAIIKGRKVADPRSGQTVWSDNPALCLSDFIISPLFGQSKAVTATSAITLANHLDTILTGTTKRSQINLVIDSVNTVANWREALRAYSHCFIVDDDNGIELIPNTIAASSHTFTDSDIIDLSLEKKSLRNSPNRVTVRYTNTDVEPWRDETVTVETADVTAGNVAPIISEVHLPGLTSYTQAYEIAQLRLNESQISDTKITGTFFDEALAVLPGDVITVTHAVGFTSELFRVTASTVVSPGRWKLEAETYSDALYSTTPQAEPVFNSVSDDDTYANAQIGIAAPVNPQVHFRLDGNRITRAQVSVDWDGTDFMAYGSVPDALIILTATSAEANKITLADNVPNIAGGEILAEGTLSVIAQSANEKQVVLWDAGDTIDTSIDLAGQWWGQVQSPTNGDSPVFKVTHYDEYAIYSRRELPFLPDVGDTLKYWQVAFHDTRDEEYRLGYCNGEVIRWDKIHHNTTTGKMELLTTDRGAEGTTQIGDLTGIDMHYFPAPGPGTIINHIPLSAFAPDDPSNINGFIGDAAIDINIQENIGWYGIACMYVHYTVRNGRPSVIRSPIVPMVYAGQIQ